MMVCSKCKQEIPDDSVFCQFCGNSQVPTKKSEQINAIDESKKKAHPSKWILIAAIIILVVVGVYFGTYLASKEYANRGDYSRAAQFLFVPEITCLHDHNLPEYISAGNNLQRGSYAEAYSSLTELSKESYLDSVALQKEAQYQYAITAYEDGDYQKAQELLAPLSADSYKDSNALKKITDNTIEYYDAMENLKAARSLSLKNGKYWACRKSYSTIERLAKEGFPLAVNGYNEAKDQVYRCGIEVYHDGKKEIAEDIFTLIPQYMRSSDYIILCKGEDYNALVKLINFEDAKDILIREKPYEFIRGTWKSEDSRYYFIMGQDYATSFNLPFQGLTRNYAIYDGVYFTYKDEVNRIRALLSGDLDDSAITKQFLFKIKDENSISVYCYADGTTYRLYRK